MRSKIVGSLALLALLLTVTANAQTQGFQTGRYYVGPRIWLGNLNGAVAFGAQVERGFTQPGSAGSGIISGGVGLDWYSWDFDYSPFGKYDYSVVPVQIFGNYHFLIRSNPRLDPYAGIALVYQHVSASWSGSGIASASASGSTTDFAGVGGLRYFLKDNFAVQGQVGFGYGTIGLGACWRL
jgi:hypothetical protein